MIKINKNEIIKYSLIASLFTNFTVGTRYIVDTKEYRKKIQEYKKEIQKSHNYFDRLIEIYHDLEDVNDKYGNRVVHLAGDLEKVKNANQKLIKENKLIHNENSKLKKSIKRKEVNSQRKLNMTVTAYTSNCKGCTGITATQYDVRNTIYYQGYRVVAADTSIIPLYSIIEIQTKTSKLRAIVIDKGGLIKGNILDLLVDNYNDAVQFGRQEAKITVLREGEG